MSIACDWIEKLKINIIVFAACVRVLSLFIIILNAKVYAKGVRNEIYNNKTI